MGKLSARKKMVKRNVEIGIVAPEAVEYVDPLDGRIAAIQLLIPLGLQAITEELQQAVVDLAGERYQRKSSDQPLRRWGSQRGSVYLGDQKLPVEVPRVRDVDSDTEVPLRAYQPLQTPRQMDEGLLLRMLKGIATRNYEACAEAVPEAFGLSSSSVSRRYVKGTARKLAEFQERSLEGYDLVALFLDGKKVASKIQQDGDRTLIVHDTVGAFEGFSDHTVKVEFADDSDAHRQYTKSWNFTVMDWTQYDALPADLAITLADLEKQERGFAIRLAAIDPVDPDPDKEVMGEIGDLWWIWDEDYNDHSDRALFNSKGYYMERDQINYQRDGRTIGNKAGEKLFPGINGTESLIPEGEQMPLIHFGLEATAYLGAGGQTAARLKAEYELLFTNRLALQPLVEVNLYGRTNAERGIGAGVSSFGFGGSNFHIALEEYTGDAAPALRRRAVGGSAVPNAGALGAGAHTVRRDTLYACVRIRSNSSRGIVTLMGRVCVGWNL